MKSMLAAIGVIAGSLLVFAATSVGGGKETELQGSWIIASSLSGGQPEKDMVNAKVTFDGDKLTVKKVDIENIDKASFRLDPTKKPKHIDFLAGPNNEKVLKGIYELSGDNLKICFGRGNDKESVRPTEFASKKDSDIIFAVLKRDKK